MKKLLPIVLLCSTTPTLGAEPISFSVVGDTPYSAGDKRDLIAGIEKTHNTLTDHDFLVHVGDIKAWLRTGAPDDVYVSPTCTAASPTSAEQMADILKKSATPVFVLIGDNEWIDCSHPDFLGIEDGEKSNAPLGWRQWQQVFPGFTAANWPREWVRQDVDWQNTTHSVNDNRYTMPNFAFVRNKVLFIGVTLPGISELPDNGRFEDPPHDNILRRLVAQDTANWIDANFDRYKDDVYASVVFAHSGIDGHDAKGPYKAIVREGDAERDIVGFVEAARRFGKPVLYIQGDKHKWKVTRNYIGLEQVTNVVVQTNELTSFTVGAPPDKSPFSWTRAPRSK